MIAVILALVLLGADVAPAEGTARPPLTNEDIVRMVAGGMPDREIVEAILDRSVAFDLSSDMIEELTAAGVSASILDAMRTRTLEDAVAKLPQERDKPGYGTIAVTLNNRTIRLPDWAGEDAKARFKLPKEIPMREVKDVAVFLACLSPEHVPDLWRSKTPLGRDMALAKQHQMLVFVAGDTPPGKAPRIALPARLEAKLDLTEPHDLLLGVAARIGDRWVQVGMGVLTQATLGPQGKPLAGHIHGGGNDFNFKIELEVTR